MSRYAFSLIELIFVIVLMGVLTGIGFYYSRPDYARQDAQYTLLKLKEARYRGIGFEGNLPEGCVTLTAAALSSGDAPSHQIRSTITTPLQTICFDTLGRPHNGNDITLTSLRTVDTNISFAYGGKSITIILYPRTGYAIIPCSN